MKHPARILAQWGGALVLLFVLCANAVADSDYLSAAWLKRGCVAAVVVDGGEENFTKQQETVFVETVGWIGGFFCGINASLFLVEDPKHKGLSYPPKDWLDLRKIAPSILHYMEQNKSVIKPETSARDVLTSWYYSSHPDSLEFHKTIAETLLNRAHTSSRTVERR